MFSSDLYIVTWRNLQLCLNEIILSSLYTIQDLKLKSFFIEFRHRYRINYKAALSITSFLWWSFLHLMQRNALRVASVYCAMIMINRHLHLNITIHTHTVFFSKSPSYCLRSKSYIPRVKTAAIYTYMSVVSRINIWLDNHLCILNFLNKNFTALSDLITKNIAIKKRRKILITKTALMLTQC